jgi:hypothetical protein
MEGPAGGTIPQRRTDAETDNALTRNNESPRPESNWRPTHYECVALPTELRGRGMQNLWKKTLVKALSPACTSILEGVGQPVGRLYPGLRATEGPSAFVGTRRKGCAPGPAFVSAFAVARYAAASPPGGDSA